MLSDAVEPFYFALIVVGDSLSLFLTCQPHYDETARFRLIRPLRRW